MAVTGVIPPFRVIRSRHAYRDENTTAIVKTTPGQSRCFAIDIVHFVRLCSCRKGAAERRAAIRRRACFA